MAAREVDQILEVLIRETGIIFTGRPVKISPGSSMSELGFDSISLVELLVAVERHFGVKMMELGVSPEDLKTLETVARRIHQVL